MNALKQLVKKKRQEIKQANEEGCSWYSQKEKEEQEMNRTLEKNLEYEAKMTSRNEHRLRALQEYFQKNAAKHAALTDEEINKRLLICGADTTVEGETRDEKILRMNMSEIVHEQDKESQVDDDHDDDQSKRRKENEQADPRVVVCFKIRDWIEKCTRMRDEEIEKLQSSHDLAKSAAQKDKDIRDMKAQNEQTRAFLAPLLRLLNKGEVLPSVAEKLSEIVDLCEKEEFLKAQHVYTDLSVGNAPWSLGVTGFGLHERAAQMRISAEQVAHLLNDETVRRYIVMIKRLMTQEKERKTGKSSSQQGALMPASNP
eukprot:GDKJ01013182.1.p1 GENE.GDKJ01013182.1~~GDKJ01013182.1.p1  ORF type:complete len:314 (-),score=88.74 GDKJ01013182.1:52-993(-)